MERLSERALVFDGEAFTRSLLKTEGIDRGCSHLAWQLSAFSKLDRGFVEPCFFRDGSSYVIAAFCPKDRKLISCEQFWGFASMLVGPDPDHCAALFERVVSVMGIRHAELSGLCAQGVMAQALRDRGFGLEPQNELAVRQVSIEGGLEGYLSRRDAHFRARMRRTLRQAEQAGVETEILSPSDLGEICQLFARILMIEKESWKAAQGESIYVDLGDFYLGLCMRLAQQGLLRMLFLKIGGQDVAYLYGFLLDGCFRGLQMSYDDRLSGLSLGNLAQLRIIEAVSKEADLYDLGMDIDYKSRWADDVKVLTTYGLQFY